MTTELRERVEALVAKWRELADDADLVDDYADGIQACTDELSAALAASPPGDAWLPIESAPKDGTRILAATDSGYLLILQWCVEGYWRCSKDREWMPAKWQPLPAPPIARQAVVLPAGEDAS
jgi:hypothetical protein